MMQTPAEHGTGALLQTMRRYKIEQLDKALREGEFERAIHLYEELALLLLEMDEISLSVECARQARDLRTRTGYHDGEGLTEALLELDGPATEAAKEIKRIIAIKKYLRQYQAEATAAFNTRQFKRAKSLLRQMLALAMQLNDKTLVKNYKSNIKKVEKAESAE